MLSALGGAALSEVGAEVPSHRKNQVEQPPAQRFPGAAPVASVEVQQQAALPMLANVQLVLELFVALSA